MRTGFTLIELSVVLVVIGLIVGGVLVGRDLIATSQIRQLGTELQHINTAITTFRSKYDCLPGDCEKATLFLGLNSGGCPAGGGTSGTCNGNGDGFVNGYSGEGNVEHIYTWQHLSLAKLMPALRVSPTAATGGATWTPLTIGTNVPASNFHPSLGYNFYSARTSNGVPFRKTIELAARDAVYLDVLAGAGLTAPQAFSLDSKIDDGRPQSGKLFGIGGGSTVNAYAVGIQVSTMNANTTCAASGAYVTTVSSGCIMEYTPSVP